MRQWLKMMNEQEKFWAGSFGDDYTLRNAGTRDASNLGFFAKVIARMGKIVC